MGCAEIIDPLFRSVSLGSRGCVQTLILTSTFRDDTFGVLAEAVFLRNDLASLEDRFGSRQTFVCFESSALTVGGTCVDFVLADFGIVAIECLQCTAEFALL